jgi:hypothetical protein
MASNAEGHPEYVWDGDDHERKMRARTPRIPAAPVSVWPSDSDEEGGGQLVILFVARNIPCACGYSCGSSMLL